eukprot:1017556-Pyramimonas_sp.AAC.1
MPARSTVICINDLNRVRLNAFECNTDYVLRHLAKHTFVCTGHLRLHQQTHISPEIFVQNKAALASLVPFGHPKPLLPNLIGSHVARLQLLPPANWTDSYRQVPTRAEPIAASLGGSRGGQMAASGAGRAGSGVVAAIGSGSRGFNATTRRGTQPVRTTTATKPFETEFGTWHPECRLHCSLGFYDAAAVAKP